jgi:general stress protein 26
MNDNSPDKTLADLMDPGTTLMVGTPGDHGDLEFRPLTVARITGAQIEILLDGTEAWTSTLASGRATVTLSDDRTNSWASLSATTSTTTDGATIDALWSPPAAAYFDDGRDSPGITVLRLHVDHGRYWSTTTGRLGSLISMVKARLGDPEQSGQHGNVAV